MNKRVALFSICIFASISLAGCAVGNVKISQPVSQSASGIMIKIPDICIVLLPCSNQSVTFARLGEDGGIVSDELYQTFTMRSDHYYLLNAKPGTYVAVAAAYDRGLNTQASSGNLSFSAKRVFGENILFSEELVRKTKVEVVSGELAIMGDYDFSIDGRMGFAPSAAQFLEAADSIQTRYAKAIDPEMESRGATSSIKFYRGNLTKSATDLEAKKRLLESANKHIGADGWGSQIANSRI